MRDIEKSIREIAEKSGAADNNRDRYGGDCRWEGILKAVFINIANTGAHNAEIRPVTSSGKKPVAFCELLYPFAGVGEEALANKMKSAPKYRTALEGAKNLLLEMLSFLSRTVFFHEFSGMDPAYKYKSALDLCEDSTDEEKTSISRDRYTSYIRSLLSGGYIDFFVNYPLLARLMATATVLWVDFIIDFISAWERDRHEIARVFFNNQKIDCSSIKVSFEGTAIFGSFIAVIEFENNKLIYKPRNINIDKSFRRLIQWVNERAGGTHLKAIRVLSRENYGWAEFAGHFQCRTEEEVRNFYKRSGMLLGILYVLGSIDMHYRNLIACGEYPVLTDLEGLVGTRDDWDISYTLFLPIFFINRNGRHAFYNTLSAETVTETYNKKIIWSNINTDSMRMGYGYLPDSPKSQVRLNGKRVFSYNYTDQILEGFTATYFFIMNNSSDFLIKFRQLFKNDKVRFFLRSDNVYASAIYNSLKPSNLKSANKGPVFEKLREGLVPLSDQSIICRIADYETHFISRLSIPRFYIGLTDGLFEGIEGLSAAGFSRCIPYESIEKKVKSLGPDDFQKQRRIIENAFSTYRSYYDQ